MLQALTDRLKQETNPNIARPIPYLVTSYTTCKEHLSHFKNMCSIEVIKKRVVTVY